MSRPWKTIYNSANRRVLVRSRPRRPKAVVHSSLLLRERVYGKSVFDKIVELVLVFLVLFLFVLFCIYLIDTCWPLFLLLMICASAFPPRKK